MGFLELKKCFFKRGCQNTCLDVTLGYVDRSFLSREQVRLALSKLEKNFVEVALTRGVEDQTGWP